MPEYNGVMMQYFHWYTEPDGALWKQLAQDAAALAESGITSLWLPPAYKGTAGGYDMGYGMYGRFEGKAEFRCNAGSVSVWIAKGR
jgi:alpha-amylase